MLDIQNLSKTFGSAKALSDVSLKVNRGEMVALIGASGSGKSTLLKHVSGLVAADKGSGGILVNGHRVQSGGQISKDIRRTRTDIGVVFQQFNLVGRLTVATNVLLGALGRTSFFRSAAMAFSPADRALASEALLKVGILDKYHQRASTLSGGQQQRAAIARALVQRASIILADEPIASLDPESSILVMELLRKLNREEGLTVLVSLHQVDYAIKYCPRAVALGFGQVLYDGPSEKLTVEKMKTIYGSGAAQMFDTGQLLPRTPAATYGPGQPQPGPLAEPQAQAQSQAGALGGHFLNA